MKERRWRYLTALVVAVWTVVAFSGCSTSTTPPREATTGLETQASPSPSKQIDGPMPASLNAAYHNAEQAFGVVSSMDWAAGTTMVTALKKSLEQVRADLKAVTSANDVRAGIVTGKEDLIDSDVSSLEDAIRAHDRDSAKRLANRLTMPIAELANMYGSSIQGELMMLRYYSRQFDIAAATDDKPLLQQTADNVRQTWSGLRPAVAAKGGITEAQHFSDLVSALEKSGPPGELGAALRDRIDEIQEVLNR